MQIRQKIPITIAVSLACLWSYSAFADDYSESLVRIVDLHQRGAPDASHELKLVEELDQLALAANEQWQADFWASYLLTQVVMSHVEGREENIERAQRHLDRALQRAAKDQAAPMADIHALQSLVYGFSVRTALTRQSAEQLKAEDEASLQRAIELDPESPVVMVMVGTDLISAGQTAEDWPQIMGGLALLRQAESKFGLFKRPKGLTTEFNREWIPPWESWVARMYEGGFEAE